MQGLRLLALGAFYAVASMLMVGQASAAYFTLDQLDNNANAQVNSGDGKHVFKNFDVNEISGDISTDASDYVIAEGYDRFSLILGANTIKRGRIDFEFDVEMADGVAEEINSTFLAMSKGIYLGDMMIRVFTEILDEDTGGFVMNDNDGDALNVIEKSPDNQDYYDKQVLKKSHGSTHVRMIVEIVDVQSIGFGPLPGNPHAPEPGSLALLGLGALTMLRRRRA